MCFHVLELSPKRYWQGPRSQEAGEEVDYDTIPKATQLSPQCLRTALRWSEISVISIALLTVRDKVTRQRPQTTTFEESEKPKRNRTEVLLLTSLTPYH